MHKFLLCLIFFLGSIPHGISQFLPTEYLKGKIYEPHPPTNSGTPTFADVDLVPGSSLTLYKEEFKSVLLTYDQIFDQVITLHPIFNEKLVLPNEYIDRFEILGHKFFNLNSLYDIPEKGFFKEIQSVGDFTAYVKTEKYIETTYSQTTRAAVIKENHRYFVHDKNLSGFTEVNQLNTLIEFLKIDRNKTRALLSANRLDFRSTPELSIQLIFENLPSLN